MEVIRLDRVSKAFRGDTLYSDISMAIEAGKITSITGANGSGKSVLFRIMCGFAKPDSGVVTIAPRYLSTKRDFPSKFGVLIDRPGFVPNLTGFQNLQKLARIQGLISDDEIRGWMTRLGLDPEAKQPVRKYSLGMRQKVALTQAFMEHPEVLILDEPFNALDKESAASVRELLKELASQGITIVFASHNESDVNDLAEVRYQIQDHDVIRMK